MKEVEINKNDIFDYDDYDLPIYLCKICNSAVIGINYNYCPECGSEIKWIDEGI